MLTVICLYAFAAFMGALTLGVAFLSGRWAARHPHPLAGVDWYAWPYEHELAEL